MPDTPTRQSFDYGSLDTDTARFVQQQTDEIKGLFRQSVENVLAIGRNLIQVKERLAHGQWLNWLVAEFDWTDRTALNFMNVAQQFKSEKLSDLNIAASALYVLAAPSTPSEAREEAITRAQAGERITVSAARDLRDKYIVFRPEPDLKPGINSYETLPETVAQEPQPAPQIPLSSEFISQAPAPVSPPLHRVEPRAAPSSAPKRKRAKEDRPLSIAPKRVQPGEWWKLGQDNYLYCGDPTSAEFQKLMPQKVALLLLSPPTREKWPQSIPNNVTSVVVDFTPYEEDQDLRLFREVVERHIQNKTDGGDIVVLAFLPDPAILPLVEQLECRFFCADPDSKHCDAAITVWTTTGGTAEKMKIPQTGKKKRLSSPGLAK